MSTPSLLTPSDMDAEQVEALLQSTQTKYDACVAIILRMNQRMKELSIQRTALKLMQRSHRWDMLRTQMTSSDLPTGERMMACVLLLLEQMEVQYELQDVNSESIHFQWLHRRTNKHCHGYVTIQDGNFYRETQQQPVLNLLRGNWQLLDSFFK
jgi:hypothetical protein